MGLKPPTRQDPDHTGIMGIFWKYSPAFLLSEALKNKVLFRKGGTGYRKNSRDRILYPPKV